MNKEYLLRDDLLFNLQYLPSLLWLQPYKEWELPQKIRSRIVVQNILHDLVSEFVAVIYTAGVLFGDEGHFQVLHDLLLLILQHVEVHQQHLELVKGRPHQQVEQENKKEKYYALRYYILFMLVKIDPDRQLFSISEEDVVAQWTHDTDHDDKRQRSPEVEEVDDEELVDEKVQIQILDGEVQLIEIAEFVPLLEVQEANDVPDLEEHDHIF